MIARCSLAAILVVLPCAAPAQQRPADHGSIVFMLGQEPTTPIPSLLGSKANTDISDLLFLRLARPGPALNTSDEKTFQPELARSWTRRDSLTLVFELDPRAKWHDGVPVTARDVLFSFTRMRDSTVDPQRTLLLRHLASVTAEGDRRVVLRFRRYYAEQFYDATFHIQLLPAHLLDTIPKERFAGSAFVRDPVGNGPYRWVRREAGRQIELAGNPGFFLGAPKVDRIVVLVVRDPEAALNLLLDGTADAYEAVPLSTGPARLAANPQLRLLASCPCRLDPLQVPEVVAVGAVQIGQRLLESHGRDLPEPRPLRGLLGERDDLSGQLHPPDERQPGPVRVLTQPEPVVVDHPGASEGAGERLTLRRGWVQPIAVSKLHTTHHIWSMGQTSDLRTGRHCVFLLHAHWFS